MMKKEEYSVLLSPKFRKLFFDDIILKFKTQTALAEYLNYKLGRKIIRENIKGWIKGKHKYGWDILIPINVLKELCVINSQNIEEVLNNAIKYNPPWKDPNKLNLLVKQNKIRLIEKNNKIYLDLTTILPKTTLESMRSRKKLPLFTKIKKDKIELWSEASWNKSIINIRRYVEIGDLFFMGLSIYTSEGSNKGNYNGSIAIGNTEPAIMNLFLEWINSFLVNYRYNCKIEFNGKSCNEVQIINFWKKEVPCIKKLKISIRKREKMGSKLINNMGLLQISISNTVLRSFILNLINKSKPLVLSKTSYSLAYLRGLLACEGSVYVRGVLKTVTIGCTDFKERMFIKNLLKNLGLNCYEGRYDIGIGNWSSFYKLYEVNAFKIPQINNYSKKDRFLKGLKNHRKTQKLIKLLLFKEKEFTANDWSKYYGLNSYICSHKYLNLLVKEEFLNFKFLRNKKYFYINPCKIEKLNNIWNL